MNLASFLDKVADERPDQIAIVSERDQLTYEELRVQANRFANALRDLGLRPGDRIAILLRNSPQFVISYYGALKAGVSIVTLCYMCMPSEVKRIACDSLAQVLITNFEFDEMVKDLSRSCHSISKFVISEPVEEEGMLSFEALLAGKRDDFKTVEVKDEHEAVLLYAPTAGETVRGCMLSHGALIENARVTVEAMRIGSDDSVLGVLPFFAAYGQTCAMNASVMAGAKLIAQPSFIPGEVLKAIEKDNVSVFMGVPTMYMFLQKFPLLYQYDLKSVRLWVSGGAALRKDVAEGFEEKVGSRIYEGYGLTEAGPAVTMMPLDEDYRLGSVGKALSGIEIKIVDNNGEELPRGEIGEIAVKSPSLMKGYFEKSEETDKIVVNGWLMTGDMGEMDEEGYLYIRGRKKDLIIRGGFNIYPREVEDVLVAHPEITEAAVVGVSDKYLGEEILAYVKIKPGSEISEEQIIDFCEETLPYYKTPKSIRFVSSFKKDPAGKIVKSMLEDV